MFPAKHDLRVYRGDTKVINLRLTRRFENELGELEVEPMDVTGHTFSSQMRADVNSTSVVAELEAVIVDAPMGHVRLTLIPEVSEQINIQNLVWDVQSVDSEGFVQTWLKGIVLVTFDVTRLEV